MKIVIDIPDKVKEIIDDNLNACDLNVYDCVMLATRNGTPLPEHHGRLIDANKMLFWLLDKGLVMNVGSDEIIRIFTQATIIEADRSDGDAE